MKVEGSFMLYSLLISNEPIVVNVIKLVYKPFYCFIHYVCNYIQIYVLVETSAFLSRL